MALLAADESVLRKTRARLFTPPPIAEFLSRWAVRSPDARVLIDLR